MTAFHTFSQSLLSTFAMGCTFSKMEEQDLTRFWKVTKLKKFWLFELFSIIVICDILRSKTNFHQWQINNYLILFLVNGAIAAKEEDRDVGLSGTLFFMALQAIMAVRKQKQNTVYVAKRLTRVYFCQVLYKLVFEINNIKFLLIGCVVVYRGEYSGAMLFCLWDHGWKGHHHRLGTQRVTSLNSSADYVILTYLSDVNVRQRCIFHCCYIVTQQVGEVGAPEFRPCRSWGWRCQWGWRWRQRLRGLNRLFLIKLVFKRVINVLFAYAVNYYWKYCWSMQQTVLPVIVKQFHLIRRTLHPQRHYNFKTNSL